MKLYNSISEIPDDECVGLTIGNFDGVHTGHQYLIDKFMKSCKDDGLKTAVITFNPHPKFILKDQTPYLICSYGERRSLLEALGIDYLIEIQFSRDFSTLSPEEFLERYLFSHSGISKICLGHDFAFGQNKQGNYELVKKWGQQRKIEVIKNEEFLVEDKRVSSTEIRALITEGKIESCNKLLGRPFLLTGSIYKGFGRGRQIGFPTANLIIEKSKILPAQGVYTTITEYQGGRYRSVTNVGVNPTFKSDKNLTVECHLLDFDKDIYGEPLKIEFLKKIRNEMKFNSVNELIAQIKRDIVQRRSFND